MPHATIHIRDEVNIKFEGLELDARRRLSNRFRYEVPYARYLPAVRLGRWDGKMVYFQLGGSTYVNLLPEILPMLEDMGYEVELDDQRDYQTHFEFQPCREDTFADRVWPPGHPQAGEPILLRDYQVEIINNFLENPQSIQEVATGAGKCLAGDTELLVSIDESSPFGKFLINKLQLEQVNDVTRNNNKV